MNKKFKINNLTKTEFILDVRNIDFKNLVVLSGYENFWKCVGKMS